MFAGELVLNHSDNLSATLQSNTISAAEGQHVASLTVDTLTKIRTDDTFTMFGLLYRRKRLQLTLVSRGLHVVERHLHIWKQENATACFSTGVESDYRQVCYEILDYAASAIKARQR